MAYYSQPQSNLSQQETQQASFLDHFEPDKHAIPKQHFVEWFTGDSALDTIWTFTDVAGTGSSAMDDAVNGGFKITTGATDDDESAINFNTINHYSQSASKILVISSAIAATRFRAGFSEDTTMGNSMALVDMDPDNTNYETTTDDGTTESSTSTGIAVDTTARIHDLEISASNALHKMDGILKVTKTTNLPDAAQMPYFAVKARSTGAKTGSIRYLEAYST